MRLWHYKLIRKLPVQQLVGQHREAAALRGLGWGKKHSTVNYVFKHSYKKLFNYHWLVMQEMVNRGYNVEPKWFNLRYRGKRLGFDDSDFVVRSDDDNLLYEEHNDDYLKECLDNLANKGVYIK